MPERRKAAWELFIILKSPPETEYLPPSGAIGSNKEELARVPMLLALPIDGGKLIWINLVLDLLTKKLKTPNLRNRFEEVRKLPRDLHNDDKIRLETVRLRLSAQMTGLERCS
ncbi:MAG TPA: hypothetical protein VFS35_08675 [Terrimicrobiaceae bacterium]|nr:hypothetical protein [Terrimicrobiaceae bacterium]